MVIIIWEKDQLKVGNKKTIGASKLIVHKKDWLPTGCQPFDGILQTMERKG